MQVLSLAACFSLLLATVHSTAIPHYGSLHGPSIQGLHDVGLHSHAGLHGSYGEGFEDAAHAPKGLGASYHEGLGGPYTGSLDAHANGLAGPVEGKVLETGPHGEPKLIQITKHVPHIVKEVKYIPPPIPKVKFVTYLTTTSLGHGPHGHHGHHGLAHGVHGQHAKVVHFGGRGFDLFGGHGEKIQHFGHFGLHG